METPQIFVAGAADWSNFHQQLVLALQAEGADVWLYEWATPNEPLSQNVEQALWQRPFTLLTVAAPYLDPSAYQSTMPRILRSGKVLIQYNPARLVLPLPIEAIPLEQWKHVFGFASPFGDLTAASPLEMIDRILTLTALRLPLPSEADSPQTRFVFGQALLSHRRFEETLAWLHPLLDAPNPPPGLYAAIAYCYAQLERWAECVEMGHAALERTDGLTASFYSLGLGYNGLGQSAHAAAAFDRALSTHSNLAGAWVGKGKALLHLGRTQEALQAFERGLAAATTHSRNAWAYEDPIVAIEAQRLIGL